MSATAKESFAVFETIGFGSDITDNDDFTYSEINDVVLRTADSLLVWLVLKIANDFEINSPASWEVLKSILPINSFATSVAFPLDPEGNENQIIVGCKEGCEEGCSDG